ncbi:MAG: hypothetical protein WCL08_10880 [Verrucomicrobiota bacterium]
MKRSTVLIALILGAVLIIIMIGPFGSRIIPEMASGSRSVPGDGSISQSEVQSSTVARDDIRPTWETEAISRSKELMSFPNPAVTNLIELLDVHAGSGWMKTHALNDACFFSVLFSIVSDWQRTDAEDDKEMLRLMKADATIESDFKRVELVVEKMSKQWNPLIDFYFFACSNHFALNYGITDATFTEKIRETDFGRTRPNFP